MSWFWCFINTLSKIASLSFKYLKYLTQVLGCKILKKGKWHTLHFQLLFYHIIKVKFLFFSQVLQCYIKTIGTPLLSELIWKEIFQYLQLSNSNRDKTFIHTRLLFTMKTWKPRDNTLYTFLYTLHFTPHKIFMSRGAYLNLEYLWYLQ